MPKLHRYAIWGQKLYCEPFHETIASNYLSNIRGTGVTSIFGRLKTLKMPRGVNSIKERLQPYCTVKFFNNQQKHIFVRVKTI